MVVDFSTLDLKEQPVLVLKNLNGSYIQPLMYAIDVAAKLRYNEVSEISFSLPARVNGEDTASYDEVVGMRIVEWIGLGQFILVNPKITNDGISEIKKCTAYSLEYEMTYKTLYLEDGTYNFWNPLSPAGTILDYIRETTGWSIGEVDSSLWNKYRTFEVDNKNAYDLIKNVLQDTYQCIFDFDTNTRKFHVRSAASLAKVEPVYLSTGNLIKEISIDEDTENIFTKVSVHGADGVDIRGVNPLGTNYIYNLDYFMNNSYFSDELIQKWEAWKTKFDGYQRPYFNLTVERVLQEAKLGTERAKLVSLQGELSVLRELQSTYVEASANGVDKAEDLADVKADIAAKEAEIKKQEELVSDVEVKAESYLSEQARINDACSLEKNFTPDELVLLTRYMKESSISEDSFVYQSVDSFVSGDTSIQNSDVELNISDSSITMIPSNDSNIYSIVGGEVNIEAGANVISAIIVRAAIEKANSGDFIFTAQLNAGNRNEVSFPAGCISIAGKYNRMDSDVSASPDIHGEYGEGSEVYLHSTASSVYFTQNTTEYTKRAVEWDLFEYGQQQLEELCWPSYTFEVDSGNFLADEDFAAFRSQFKLGSKVYLDIADGHVLNPIAVGVDFKVPDPNSFKVYFGDKYSAKDSSFQIVDLLKQSVSMGKTVATNRRNYNSFIDSNASSELHAYINNALDAVKQAVLAGKNQDVVIDGSGILLRHWNAAAGKYDDEQSWIINNQIVFTEDGWSTAKMALGHVVNSKEGIDSWGLVADALVGKILAGENLIVEAVASDGNTVLFRVDGNGAQLHNARFDLIENNGQITLYPGTGLVGGNVSTSSPLFTYGSNGAITGIRSAGGKTYTKVGDIVSTDLPNANFWVDMNGGAFFRGKVYATDGQFNGTVYATDGQFKGTINATNFQLDGVSINNVFKATGQDILKIGGITINGNNNTIDMGNGAITWGGNNPAADKIGSSEAETIARNEAAKAVADKITSQDASSIASTVITQSLVASPYIKGGTIEGGSVTGAEISGGTLDIGYGNFEVDEKGNVTMKGSINLSGGSITWGSNAPVKSQYSSDGITGWSSTQRTTDIYRRDWDYVTETWGIAYKFVGIDGKPGKDGQDGNPRAYLQSIGITEITASGVKSPKIEGGEIWGADIYGGAFYDLDGLARLELNEEGNSGIVGPVLRYVDNSNGHEAFKIWSWHGHCYMGLCGGLGWNCSPTETDEDSDGNECQIYHALGTHVFNDKVRFEYCVDFSNAKVEGLVPVWG